MTGVQTCALPIWNGLRSYHAFSARKLNQRVIELIPFVCVDPQVADQVAPPREGLSAAGLGIEAGEGTSEGGAIFVDEVEDVHAVQSMSLRIKLEVERQCEQKRC